MDRIYKKLVFLIFLTAEILDVSKMFPQHQVSEAKRQSARERWINTGDGAIHQRILDCNKDDGRTTLVRLDGSCNLQ